MRSSAVAPLLVVLLALASSGCGQGGADAATTSKPKCPAALKLGWQTLANRIDTDVYCPAWLPNPLVGKIDKGEAGAADNAVLSVSKDKSYLASWIWVEAQTGEVHVILRAYPGRTTIPTCVVTDAGSGKQVKHRVPCFADPHGTDSRRADHGDAVHGQPGRRPVAPGLRLAPRRNPVHGQPARRRSAHLRHRQRRPAADPDAPGRGRAGRLTVELTRRQLLAGVGATTLAAAGHLRAGRARRPRTQPARGHGAAARAARAGRAASRHRQQRRGGGAAAAPRDRHVPAAGRRPRRPARRAAPAGPGAGRPRPGLRVHPGRSGRDRGVGAAVLHGPGGGAGARPRSGRSPRLPGGRALGLGAAGRDPLPERHERHAARARTTRCCCCEATTRRTSTTPTSGWSETSTCGSRPASAAASWAAASTAARGCRTSWRWRPASLVPT